jgi:hypothetical protein
MLDVRLLGEQRIAGGDSDRATTARSLELLAYLITHADVREEVERLVPRVEADPSEDAVPRGVVEGADSLGPRGSDGEHA